MATARSLGAWRVGRATGLRGSRLALQPDLRRADAGRMPSTPVEFWQLGAFAAFATLLAVFFKPVMATLFAGPLGRMALAAQPDTITLEPKAFPRWADEVQRQRIADQMREAGFELAGWFTVPQMPGVQVALFAHEGAGAYAASYEHPHAGVWSECISFYEDGGMFVCVGHASFGLDPMPGVQVVHRPGLDAAAVWAEMQRERPTGELREVQVDATAAEFCAFYAADMAHRKQRGMSRREVVRATTRRAA